jgi:hypothetical protein
MAEKITLELEAKLGDAVKKLDGIEKQLVDVGKESKKASKGIGGIKTALTGVGAVLTGGLFKAGSLIFEKLTELFMSNQTVVDSLSIAMNGLKIVFNDIVGFITDISIPSFTELKDSIMQGLIDRFNQAKDVAGLLGKAVVKLFKGDFSGAVESLKEAGKESVDVLTGQDKSFEKVTESVKNYAKETFNAAKRQSDLNTQAQLAEAINAKLLQQYDRDAELQRQIRDDVSLTIEERIAANKELGRILDEQQKVMMDNAQQQVDAAQAALDIDKDNLDLQIALINAQTELADVEAHVTGLRAEQLTNINSLLQEQKDAEDELRKIKADAINEELKKKQEASAKAKKLKEAETKAAQEQDKAALGSIMQLAGEGSAVGKAAAVAQVTMAGIEGVQNAYKTAQASPITVLNPAYPVIQAALAGAMAASQLAAIMAVPKPSKSGGGGGGGNPAGAMPAAPPAFNIVGAAPENQLAVALGQNESKPVKAFVVSNDVSTAQALDRNIVESATI